MTTTKQQQAVQLLDRAGYQVTADTLKPEVVIVADPVACSNGLQSWTEYKTTTVRVSQVTKFIAARS